MTLCIETRIFFVAEHPMDTIEKLKILSADSQYDLACACGTRKDEHRKRGQDGKWLYPVSLPQGGYSVLLKTLLSNACANDCKYKLLSSAKIFFIFYEVNRQIISQIPPPIINLRFIRGI